MSVKTPWNNMTKTPLVQKLSPQTLAAHAIRVMESRAATAKVQAQ